MMRKECPVSISALFIAVSLVLGLLTFQAKAADGENILSVNNGGQLMESAGNLPDWPEEGWDGTNDENVETWDGTVTVFNQPQEGGDHPWAIFAFAGEEVNTINMVRFFMLTEAVVGESLQSRCAKDFRVQVSESGTAEGDFQTVMEDAIDMDINVAFGDQEWQEFSFPAVDAKYVKLILLSNYGDGTYTSLGEFEVYSADTSAPVSSPGKLSTTWAKLKAE
jgi:hypothetical protein